VTISAYYLFIPRIIEPLAFIQVLVQSKLLATLITSECLNSIKVTGRAILSDNSVLMTLVIWKRRVSL
jgi:hypothetical protein